MIDIVLPDSNEEEFLETAGKLGYKGVCFLYTNKNELEKAKKNLKNSFFAKLSAPKDAKKDSKYADLVIVKGNSRNAFENSSIDLVFDLEKTHKRDSKHYKKSGLNQVLCTLAHKKRIMVGISLLSLNCLQDERLKYMGRIIQNIRLCRKYDVDIVFASFARSPWQMRSPHDMQSFLRELGETPKRAAEALTNVEKRITENIEIRTGKRFAEGIYLK